MNSYRYLIVLNFWSTWHESIVNSTCDRMFLTMSANWNWAKNLRKSKKKEINEIECDEIENWREKLSRACVDSNVSNLSDLKTNEIVALKYDVMRICMNSKLRELHLSKFCKNVDLFWRDCKSNDFDFSTNMRNKSFTIR